MIKYGIIRSKELFERLSNIDYAKPQTIFDCIPECVEIKISVVEADEQDKNERRLLNFGHTVGHAIEALSDYRVPHGTAVAIGSVAAAKISHRLGLCDVNIVAQIENIFEKAGVDTRLVYDKQQVIHAIMHDKKRQGDKITLVLCEKIDYGVLRDIEISKLSDLMEDL